MKGELLSKEAIGILIIGLIAFLVISAPGWQKIMGVDTQEGTNNVVLAGMVIFIIGAMFLVLKK